MMKEDPNFKQMITVRDSMHSQIRSIRSDLLSKKKVVDSQIEKIRQEYDSYAKAQNIKIEQCQSAVDTNRNLLKHEVETAGAQLNAKLTEKDGYEKTLSDIKKVLRESKSISITKKERDKWEERMLMLSEKIRPLAEEIEDLKVQISLKKKKMSYLK